MSYRGLDFGSGLNVMAEALARGYRDHQEMLARNKQLEILQQQADFSSPNELVIPMPVAQLVGQLPQNVFAESTEQGSRQQPNIPRQPKTIVPYNSATGQMGAPVTPQIPGQTPEPPPYLRPNREPQGDLAESAAMQGSVQEAAIAQDPAATEALAKSLGLTVRDGQLVAKGAQGKAILDLYEKLLGASAAAYGYGARPPQGQGGGVQIMPYRPPTARPGTDPNAQTIKQLMARQDAIRKEFGLEGKLRDTYDVLKKKSPDRAEEYRNIETRLRQLMGTGGAAPAPTPAPGAPAATKAPSPAREKKIREIMEKGKLSRERAEQMLDAAVSSRK